ncbi:MAG: hypothetical protein RSC43_00490 [Clostridia bacterium]
MSRIKCKECGCMNDTAEPTYDGRCISCDMPLTSKESHKSKRDYRKETMEHAGYTEVFAQYGDHEEV